MAEGEFAALASEDRHAQELVAALVGTLGSNGTWAAFVALARAEGIRRAERASLIAVGFVGTAGYGACFEREIAALNDAVAIMWGSEAIVDDVRDALQKEARTTFWRRAAQIADAGGLIGSDTPQA